MVISTIVVFFGGVLAFFSPCILPLIPAYLSLITGMSLAELKSGNKWSVMPDTIAFCIGFSLVFVLMGATFTAMWKYLSEFEKILELAGGGVLILFALHTLRILEIKYLYLEKRLTAPKGLKGRLGAILVGMAFSIGWSPCVGTILASVLALAADTKTVLQGMIMLSAFSAGLSLPFMLTGFFIERVVSKMKFLTAYARYVEIISGVLIAAIGIWLLYKGLFV